MVSYFVPRGRFLIKAGNLRHAAHQKHQQVQQQQKSGKWPMLLQFRQTFSTKSTNQSAEQLKLKTSFDQRNTLSKRTYSDGKLDGRRPFDNAQNQQQQQQQQQQQRRNVWKRWAGLLLRWAPIGFCVFGAIEWQLHKQKTQREYLPRTASEFQSKVYCSLPLRIVSRCWGWLASCYIPVSFRPFVYGWYSNRFSVNLDEALHNDYTHYNSLAEFFTRPLRDGVRIIDTNATIVSPADGKVLHFGTASNSLIEQVKGVNYDIQTFLGPSSWSSKNGDEYAESIKQNHDGATTLYQCVIYLAPGDYHRFHSPTEWEPTVRRHFSGELLSVSPKIATWLPGLFCLNERVLYVGNWKYGFFSYTAVGATNVGSVQILMDEHLRTNRWMGLHIGSHKNRHEYDEMALGAGTTLKRGDLVGQFNMGSTIVLLFEAPKNFEFQIQAGQKIQVGEPLGTVIDN